MTEGTLSTEELDRLEELYHSDYDTAWDEAIAEAFPSLLAEVREGRGFEQEAAQVVDNFQRSLAKADAEIAALKAAGQAVIDQWDTPNWKLTEPTGKLVDGLRAAIRSRTQAEA